MFVLWRLFLNIVRLFNVFHNSFLFLMFRFFMLIGCVTVVKHGLLSQFIGTHYFLFVKEETSYL